MYKKISDITKEYIEEIHENGMQRVLNIQNMITNRVNDVINKSDILIYTLGSDGRKENMPKMSPGELLIIGNNMKINQEIAKCLKLELQKDNRYTTETLGNYIEIQDCSFKPTYYYPYFNLPEQNIFFPTRFLDKALLFGDKEKDILQEGRYNSFIKDISKSNKSQWKRRIMLHKEISESGYNTRKDKRYEHFGPSGITYNKALGLEIGIKLGPLRYLQYSIMGEILNHKNINIQDIIGKPTIDKIDFMRSIGILGIKSEEEYDFIIKAYYYFLNIHHTMQKTFVEEKKPFTYHFQSEDEKKEFFAILDRFNKIIKNKIGKK